MAATAIAASFNQGDEDYIDMEVTSSSSPSSSSTTFSSVSTPTSPPQTRDFEFQMSSSISQLKETTPSPADELFYNGKLLPLHLPPRIQMVEKLCEKTDKLQPFQESHFITLSTTPSTSTNTPLASCNISPSESCRVSSELNPNDYFFEWSSTEFRGFISDNPKKSWSKKLKQIKHLSLSQKLRTSKAYFKSLFSKSTCTDEGCAKPAACSTEVEKADSHDDKDLLSKCINAIKNNPIEQNGKRKYPTTLAHVMKSIEKDEVEESLVDYTSQRKSFSGAIKRHSSRTKLLSSSSSSSLSASGSSSSSSSSSSFSLNSPGFYELQFFKRSCSASSELESSIEAAIAHCKNSQHIFRRNGLKDTGICSPQSVSTTALSEVKIQEKPSVDRI